jgi:hypothetical protein
LYIIERRGLENTRRRALRVTARDPEHVQVVG